MAVACCCVAIIEAGFFAVLDQAFCRHCHRLYAQNAKGQGLEDYGFCAVVGNTLES